MYATARKNESMQGFRSDGIRKLVLDVTCEDQIRNVVQTIMEKEGRIDVLVNNAGVGNTGERGLNRMTGIVSDPPTSVRTCDRHPNE